MQELDPRIVRGAAFELHNKVDWSQHPCSKGNGECCEAETPVNEHDEAIINEAIADNRISRKIIRSAKRRVENGSKKCGFLNERKECTVYEYRPAICAVTGTGAAANLAFPETKEAADNYMKTGIDEDLPVEKLVSGMCRSCTDKLIKQKATFKASDVYFYSIIIMHYGGLSPARPISSFIKTLKK